MVKKNKPAKPFLKWAGGKTQLIREIEARLPGKIVHAPFIYIEPFVGSGAVLFRMLHHFPNIEKAVINDINADLINTYKVIAASPKKLIAALENLQQEFHALDEDKESKQSYFYAKRDLYNARKEKKVIQAALFIFLNRTCFNGLYRVNSSNDFNVPMGSYKKPTICDAENILAVSKMLEKVTMLCGDYEQTTKHAGANTFFYFDPPYKPLSETSNFNAYAKNSFGDEEQKRLKNYCARLDREGHQWMLSNSDVRHENPHADFFDDLYSDFIITRVKAKRRINAQAEKRGALSELLITNYRHDSTGKP